MPADPILDVNSEKRDLSSHVREVLAARHGSMAAAAEALAFPYERLKKAVQRNSFSGQDLEILLPTDSLASLRDKFSFTFSRRVDPSSPPRAGRFELYGKIEAGLRSFQKGARDIDFSTFVDDLYENIGPGLSVQAMTLFCAGSSLPLEWGNEQAQKKLAHALREGAIVIYVMETDLIGTIQSDNIATDDLDRQFGRFLDRLDDLRDEEAGGFIALVRVRKCAYCTPFQKPTLFSCVPDDPDAPTQQFALTTIDVPELATGEGALGTAVLPQRDEVAAAMRDYLIDLIRFLKRQVPDPIEFHFQASSRHGERSADLALIIEQLERITRPR